MTIHHARSLRGLACLAVLAVALGAAFAAPPVLTGVVPGTVGRGAPATVFELSGSAFEPAATVVWTDVGAGPDTTLVPDSVTSSTILVTVPPALLDAVGTAQVRVRNPDPDGDSAPLPVTIVARVTLPAASAAFATDLVIPVTVDPVDGAIAFDLAFTFDPAVLDFVAAYRTALTAPFTLYANEPAPGVVDMSLYGIAPLAGAGDVVWLAFDVLGTAPATTALHWTQADLNEGLIPSLAVDGSVSVAAPAAVLALPDGANGAPAPGPASTVYVPLAGTGVSGATSVTASVVVDATRLETRAVRTTALTASWTIDSVDTSVPGTITFQLSGPALAGDGALCEVELGVLATAPAGATPLDLRTASLDGGALAAALDDGLFTVCADADADGVTVCGGDCDDGDPDRFPGNPEVACDGTDDDCDLGTADAPDADADTWDICGPADGANPDGKPADCDDARAATHPGAIETCNLQDDDCDAAIDENPDAALASCDDGDLCTVDVCTAGTCSNDPGGNCGVSGTVRYYRTHDLNGDGTADDPFELSTGPVPGVDLDLAERAGSPDATTGPDGSYAFGALTGGPVTLSPLPKVGPGRADGGATGSITAADATHIARSTVSLVVLTDLQKLAADVTGNGSVTSFDASYVAQYGVQLIDRFPVGSVRGSDWAFLSCAGGVPSGCPAWTPHPPAPVFHVDALSGQQVVDFHGVLYGDVTGNWSAPALLDAARPGEAPSGPGPLRAAPVPAPRTEPATIYVADGPEPLADGRMRVVLGLSNADGIQALDLRVEAVPGLARDLTLRATGLASGFGLVQRAAARAVVGALYGVVPMTGSGPFLEVIYRTRGSATAGLPLRWDVVANEGLVPVELDRETGRSPGPR